MAKIDPVQNALQGVLRAEDRLAKAAEKVSVGDVSAESMVAVKQEELAVKVQLKNLKKINEIEDEVLDLLA